MDLVHGFNGTEDFYVNGELVTDNFLALHPFDGEHTTVLPSLCKVFVLELVSSTIQGPLLEATESFIASQRLYGHPVQEYLLTLIDTSEEIQGRLRYSLHCHLCPAPVSCPQELHRHIKEKHTPPNECLFCDSFKWSLGHRHLYRGHLEVHHPGVVLVGPRLLPVSLRHVRDYHTASHVLSNTLTHTEIPDASVPSQSPA